MCKCKRFPWFSKNNDVYFPTPPTYLHCWDHWCFPHRRCLRDGHQDSNCAHLRLSTDDCNMCSWLSQDTGKQEGVIFKLQRITNSQKSKTCLWSLSQRWDQSWPAQSQSVLPVPHATGTSTLSTPQLKRQRDLQLGNLAQITQLTPCHCLPSEGSLCMREANALSG